MSDNNVLLLANLIILAPLLSGVVIGLSSKKLPRAIVNWFSCSLLALSSVLSIFMWAQFLRGGFKAIDHTLYVWGDVVGSKFVIGYLLDGLSLCMMTVVSCVSFLVHIYSIGYMHDDEGYNRFFAYISLFTFSMLALVMGNNFLQLFFGWEAVGLMSYLLIGFWFKKPSAIYANLKAFIVNRVGDLGFILGIAGVWYFFASMNYVDVFAKVGAFMEHVHTVQLFPGHSYPAMAVICFCLFIGAMAKSAQVPLHVWLPDSMEGPTPISALIHAATMVTAGIYMVARMSPLFEYSGAVLSFIVVIGALGSLFLGILALVQNDIKRIIAYSTLSQLGYMTVALGVSAYSAAIFHLVTHAFFKSLLFLGAGSVILAMHHEQNIFAMGGLRKKMPITFWTMLLGSLAMLGFPGLAGFYSKDLIIFSVQHASLFGANFAYFCVLSGVFVTALYSFRLLFVVFFGKEKTTNHAVEQSRVVTVPLIILAFSSVGIGAALMPGIMSGIFGKAIYVLPKNDVVQHFAWHDYHGWLAMAIHGFLDWPFWLMLTGVVVAWICYVRQPQIPKTLQHRLYLLWDVLNVKYGFDWLYEKIMMPVTRWVGKVCWRYVDLLLIDDVMVNGSARVVNETARFGRKLQSGYLYHYVFLVVIAVMILVWMTTGLIRI